MVKAKESKKQLLDFVGKSSYESQTKAGIAVDFDMVALMGLAYALYTLGPNRTVNSFLGFWGDLFGSVAAGFGNVLGGGVDWVADGVGDAGGWLKDMLGL